MFKSKKSNIAKIKLDIETHQEAYNRLILEGDRRSKGDKYVYFPIDSYTAYVKEIDETKDYAFISYDQRYYGRCPKKKKIR